MAGCKFDWEVPVGPADLEDTDAECAMEEVVVGMHSLVALKVVGPARFLDRHI